MRRCGAAMRFRLGFDLPVCRGEAAVASHAMIRNDEILKFSAKAANRHVRFVATLPRRTPDGYFIRQLLMSRSSSSPHYLSSRLFPHAAGLFIGADISWRAPFDSARTPSEMRRLPPPRRRVGPILGLGGDGARGHASLSLRRYYDSETLMPDAPPSFYLS